MKYRIKLNFNINYLTILIAIFMVSFNQNLSLSYEVGHSWGINPVPYYINPQNNDVSEDAAEAAIVKGANTWSNLTNANIAYEYLGRTSLDIIQDDAVNIVIFRNESNGDAVATNYNWWNGTYMTGSDIIFWDGSRTFFTGTSGCSGGYYIEDIATHEMGHGIGMLHSESAGATMGSISNQCTPSGRSLDSDDIAGIEFLYPPVARSSDTINPFVSISAPSNNATISGTISLGVNVSDNIGVVGVKFLLDGVLLGDEVTSAPFSISWDTTLTSSGTHQLTAIATDAAGNTRLSSIINTTVEHSFIPELKIENQNPDIATFALKESYAYPNPSQGAPIIRIKTGLADQVNIRVFNVAGKEVHKTSISQVKVIDNAYVYEHKVMGLASGVYLYVAEAIKDEQILRVKGKIAIIK